eukprot:m.94513 g.94513  ORF g.94513 m.94513 type:complete len:382 (-) comp16544_c0_seq1:276-1421(-)
MSLDSIVKEYDRIKKRKRQSRQTADSALADIERALTRCKNETSATGAVPLDAIQDAIKKIDSSATSIKKANKEVTSALNKCGKSIDKIFEANISKVGTGGTFQGGESLCKEITDHFLRQGRWSIGETFMKESEIDINADRMTAFQEIHTILHAIEQRDLQPALRWATRNSEKLASVGSRLEFLLHRLVFVTHVVNGERLLAVQYAKDHFALFAGTEMNEIQRLLGSIVYIKRLSSSKYAYYKSHSLWKDAADLCAAESARFMGLPKHSPMSICVNAGCVAAPKLLKVMSVLSASKKDELMASSQEMPVEIDLGNDHLYHSVFCCPVSREAASTSNPPMRLPCGHVICHDSIRRIAKGVRRRFKCPYCPMESTLNDVQKLRF